MAHLLASFPSFVTKILRRGATMRANFCLDWRKICRRICTIRIVRYCLKDANRSEFAVNTMSKGVEQKWSISWTDSKQKRWFSYNSCGNKIIKGFPSLRGACGLSAAAPDLYGEGGGSFARRRNGWPADSRMFCSRLEEYASRKRRVPVSDKKRRQDTRRFRAYGRSGVHWFTRMPAGYCPIRWLQKSRSSMVLGKQLTINLSIKILLI